MEPRRTGSVSTQRGRNPLLPLDVYLPDPEAHVMSDGRLYLYGSQDTEEGSWCSDQYRFASTADMSSWTVHDVAFRAEQARWATHAASAGRSALDGASSYDELPPYLLEMLPPGTTDVPFDEFASAVRAETLRRQPPSTKLYAPDAIEWNGKYYLYLCLSDGTEGVAVAQRPEGPFGDSRQLPVSGIDPAVFIDDDGQAYYYWGQFSASAGRLNPDMVSLDLDSVVADLATEQEHHFHEGSSMRRRADTYYLVFTDTSRGRPTCLGYATSASPLGPFTYRGVIIDNAGGDPNAWNNHGSIEEFGGRWYVFYHRSSRNVSSMRRACAEPIHFAADGTIAEVPMTSQGAGAPFARGETIPAFTACHLTGGAYIAPHGASEAIIGINDGASVVFRYLDLKERGAAVHLTGSGTATVDVLIDGELAGCVEMAGIRAELDVEAGRHEVGLVFRDPQACVLVDLRFE